MVSVVTLADARRAQRVQYQHDSLENESTTVRHGVVILGEEKFAVPGVTPIAHLASKRPLLAQARNAAGDWAAQAGDDEVIIFLDADCLAAPQLVERYAQALAEDPDAVVSGPVTYLEPEDSSSDMVERYLSGAASLAEKINPHPARPYPDEKQMFAATVEQYNVFWSLTFAMTARTWRKIRALWGGFDESFEGYGGEDTDFGWQLRDSEVELWWVGGAHAFHVWHPVSSPPWQNLAEIVPNANRFYEKWGEWAMLDWLKEFEQADAVRLVNQRWELTKNSADRVR